MNKNTMKAFVGNGWGKGSFVDIPRPVPKENEVLIKIAYCGVCGTDQDLFSSQCSFAENGQVTYPVRLGHEWSGTVAEVGSAVTKFKAGDRVVGDNAVCCGECDACRRGDYGKCRNTRNVGTIEPVYDGAFAEYMILPEYHVYHLPDSLSLKEAALCEPLSVAQGAVKKMDITKNSTVVIIGTGCIGLSAAVLALCKGAEQVFLTGRNPVKLAAAEKLGVIPVNVKKCDAVSLIKEKTGGRGADFVIECSGAEGTIVQAMDMVMRRGMIALIGFYEKKEREIDIDKIVSNEITIVGIMGEYGNIGEVLDVLGEHEPSLLPLITAELPFEECEPAFMRQNTPDTVKTVIRIGGGN
ncbi:MAG: hypothetical protein E7638_03570 [Ruminococcaceae bacterium]|nr:hypothetical protein [Oscillospiraceae bacterium]